jgi:hypothetical protein
MSMVIKTGDQNGDQNGDQYILFTMVISGDQKIIICRTGDHIGDQMCYVRVVNVIFSAVFKSLSVVRMALNLGGSYVKYREDAVFLY